MIDLADFQRRFYHDGPDIPETPELQTAEPEYRHAFLAAAREAASWNEPDEEALKKPGIYGEVPASRLKKTSTGRSCCIGQGI